MFQKRNSTVTQNVNTFPRKRVDTNIRSHLKWHLYPSLYNPSAFLTPFSHCSYSSFIWKLAEIIIVTVCTQLLLCNCALKRLLSFVTVNNNWKSVCLWWCCWFTAAFINPLTREGRKMSIERHRTRKDGPYYLICNKFQ